jgi:hypothetical protein
MIGVGAHGWSAVGRVLHGSVSTAVVHEARCPVLVVPSKSDVGTRPLEPLDGVVRTREKVA